MLEAHPKWNEFLHPGLESHPQHETRSTPNDRYGGTFSFTVKGGEEETSAYSRGQQAFHLGGISRGVESLIEHPWSMTHASMPKTSASRGNYPQYDQDSVGSSMLKT